MNNNNNNKNCRENTTIHSNTARRGGPITEFIRKMLRTINTVEGYFLYAVINS